MFHLDIFMIAVILTSASALPLCSDDHKGPCKRTNQCQPSVTPENSTHLLVNWENVFEEGCEDGYIEKMEIETREETTTSVTHKKVKLSQKETLVKANPCLQHIITVKMIMTPTYSRTYGRGALRTPAMDYNKIVSIWWPFEHHSCARDLPESKRNDRHPKSTGGPKKL